MKELRNSIALKMNAIVVKAFNLYQHMSPPVLRVKWDDIVEDICLTEGWLNDKGEKSTVVRGQTWDMLVKCKRTHLLTIYNETATKRWYSYRTVTIKKTNRPMIKLFWNRVRELDK